MTDQNATQDPFDSAMNPELRPRSNTYFGEVAVDVWHCVLEKGVGKVDFDPAVHSADRRCTAIKIAIDAYKRDMTTYSVEREMIAESNEWAKIVLPSLRALSRDLRGINGKWARVELAQTGQSYKNKNGETKQRTTFKFVEVYDSQIDCLAAMEIYFAADRLESGESIPAGTPPPANGANNAERETARKFLEPLWAASGKDLARFEALIKSQDLVARHFSMASPEVIALIKTAMA